MINYVLEFCCFCLFASISGSLLFLLQDSHQCRNISGGFAWDYEWQCHGIFKHNQYATTLQPLSWGTQCALCIILSEFWLCLFVLGRRVIRYL